jgi:GlpG protein
MTNFGKQQSTVRLFTITDLATANTPAPSLYQELATGEVWRLVTPIFIHFTLLHLIFNMLWLSGLGGLIEHKRGPLRFPGLVLLVAIPSNIAQLYLGDVTMNAGFQVDLFLNPNFGGMSGVVYGLFGYVWMKSRYEPQLGMSINTESVVILIAWFFLCLTGWVGPVANMAHAVGLVVGILAGLVPTAGEGERTLTAPAATGAHEPSLRAADGSGCHSPPG